MVHLDTNFLILAMAAGSPHDAQLRTWINSGEAVSLDAIVWAEFACGPVTAAQLDAARAFVPSPQPFLAEDALRAAALFNDSGRRRGSLIDCMIAAVCLRLDASLATSNVQDFKPFERSGLRIIAA
jgi:predicted nucleic acid-binding protein